MKRVSIMQPYFIPYIGYWQMLNDVDTFMILDDVNFIRQGWIHRNRIRCEGKEKFIVLPVKKISSNVLIKDSHFVNEQKYLNNLLATIRYAYRNSPYLETGLSLMKEILFYPETSVSLFLKNQIIIIANYLDIETEIIMASDYRDKNHSKGQEGIIELCNILKADIYINSIGGKHLYDSKRFEKENMTLKFIQANFDDIKSISNREYMDYSIIDLIMNFSKDDIKRMLQFKLFE